MTTLALKFLSILNHRLKAGALYIAIIVSIVIGVLLSMFILLAQYNQRSVTAFTQSTQLYYNLKSAFEIAQSDYFRPNLNDKWFKNTSNDDSIKIKKLNWLISLRRMIGLYSFFYAFYPRPPEDPKP